MPYIYDTLMGECPDESNAAKFFQNCGLLHTERFCHCGSQMRPSMVKCVPARNFKNDKRIHSTNTKLNFDHYETLATLWDVDSASIRDKQNWPGKNVLGRILTRIRDVLRSKKEYLHEWEEVNRRQTI
uniref:PPIase cyclophilin-type domain-containing protein n=1 Tax=Meloidogyne hapla TaxID=6305 RepID=A0A1I8B9Z7_MELHA